MGKGFKLKLSRVIPSFQSCRSKDPSTLPSNPVPSFLRLPPPPPPVNQNNIMSFNPHYKLPSPLSSTPTPPTSSKPLHYSSIKRHLSSALTSIGCGSRSRSTDAVPSETGHTRSPPQGEEEFYHWEKEEKFHVVARSINSTPRRKIYHDAVSFSPPPVPVPPNTDNDEETKKKKRRRPRHRKKTTKADQYASETETLVEKGRTATTRRPKRCVLAKTAGRTRKKNGSSSCSEYEKDTSLSGNTTPARLSKFQWMIPCAVEGKVRESFAVVKRSEDPYEDFKRSMMEMVLEKGMFEEEDLEQLLQCFLSLNDRDHHGVIVRAFSEVWHALFV